MCAKTVSKYAKKVWRKMFMSNRKYFYIPTILIDELHV